MCVCVCVCVYSYVIEAYQQWGGLDSICVTEPQKNKEKYLIRHGSKYWFLQ